MRAPSMDEVLAAYGTGNLTLASSLARQRWGLPPVSLPKLVMLDETCPKCGAPLMHTEGEPWVECMMLRDGMGYGNCDYGRLLAGATTSGEGAGA